MPMWVQTMFWLLYMVVWVYAMRRTLMGSWGERRKAGDATWLILLYFILYTVFYCGNPDYFRYREWIWGRSLEYWGKEEVYVNLVLFCRWLGVDYPFEVFRLIVWGGAVLLAFSTLRMGRGLLRPRMTLVMLFVFYANTFSYARASLAMGVYFLGIGLYLCRKGSLMKVLGLVLAMSSYYLHNEMIIGIVVLPCLFFGLERKRFSYLSLVFIGLMALAIWYVGSNLHFLDSMFDGDEMSSKIEHLNEKEQRRFRMSTLTSYLCYLYPFYLAMRRLWKGGGPRLITGMYRVSYGIVIVSVAFMLVMGARSVYAYRVLYMGMIPLSLMMGYFYCNGCLKKREWVLMMILGLLANSVRFFNMN